MIQKLIAVLVLVATLILLAIKKTQRQTPLPPGPPADPLIGHLRKIPKEDAHAVYYELGKIYGDVIYLEVLSQPIIVLNSVKAAVDLLEKRSANYSDRPRFVVYELMGWVRSLTFLPYGKRFHKIRRMFQEHLELKNAMAYQPIQTQEARILLQTMMSNTTSPDKVLRRFTTSIIIRAAYGYRATSDDDPLLSIIEELSEAMSNAGPPGSTPVDFFPFLHYLPSWFPGAYYAGFARSRKDILMKLYELPFRMVQEDLKSGKAIQHSFLSKMLQSLSPKEAENPDTLLDVKGAAAILYCAGSETTWSTLSCFLLAMILYPECQRKAQKEIDSVVGPGRLPDFSDRDSLPYVECILQETLRWNSVLPLGVPHRSLEDDVYRGMFIPKGSIIFANTRAMSLDEKIYSNSQTFNPSRYLPPPDGNNEPYPNGPFGFGRRLCPGRQLADASLWIVMASMLATFDISKAIGSDGKEVTPTVMFQTSLVSRPTPYDCRILPRNEQARNLIVNADTSDNH